MPCNHTATAGESCWQCSDYNGRTSTIHPIQTGHPSSNLVLQPSPTRYHTNQPRTGLTIAAPYSVPEHSFQISPEQWSALESRPDAYHGTLWAAPSTSPSELTDSISSLPNDHTRQAPHNIDTQIIDPGVLQYESYVCWGFLGTTSLRNRRRDNDIYDPPTIPFTPLFYPDTQSLPEWPVTVDPAQPLSTIEALYPIIHGSADSFHHSIGASRPGSCTPRPLLVTTQYEASPVYNQPQAYSPPYPTSTYVPPVHPSLILMSQSRDDSSSLDRSADGIVRDDSESFQSSRTLVDEQQQAGQSQKLPLEITKTKVQNTCCPECKISFKCKPSLYRHQREAHRNEGSYMCPPAGLVTCIGSTEQCAICNEQNPTTDHFLKEHKFQQCYHNPKTGTRKRFKRKDEYLGHLERHDIQEQSLLLQRCLRFSHNKGVWGCGYCAELFHDWSLFQEHLTNHMQNSLLWPWNHNMVMKALLLQNYVRGVWKRHLTTGLNQTHTYQLWHWNEVECDKLQSRLEDKKAAADTEDCAKLAFSLARLGLDSTLTKSVRMIDSPQSLGFNLPSDISSHLAPGHANDSLRTHLADRPNVRYLSPIATGLVDSIDLPFTSTISSHTSTWNASTTGVSFSDLLDDMGAYKTMDLNA